MIGKPMADVLVIGSGAAGAALSLRLSEKGANVVCLEQGDWIDRSRLPKAHLDWEVRGRRHWAANPNVRRWTSDYPVGSDGENPVDIYMYNAVGGSTIGFAGNYWRLAPSDFPTTPSMRPSPESQGLPEIHVVQREIPCHCRRRPWDGRASCCGMGTRSSDGIGGRPSRRS